MKLPQRFVFQPKRNPLFLAALALSAAVSAHAVPYASCITNDFANNTVYYYLNEDASSVKFIVGATTNDLGGQSKGLHNVAVSGATSYRFEVAKATPATWVRTADNALGGTNANKFARYFSPGGIAPYQNAKDLSRFGRIYVLENGGGNTAAPIRTVGKGLYILNADQSDALGRNDTSSSGGITWTAGNGAATDGVKSPWKVEVGADGNLYVSDFSTNNGGVFQFDPDVTVGQIVLATPGRNGNIGVHTDIESSPIVKGSLAGGNLQLWAVDGAWPVGGFNRLLRWDINSGPLPWNTPPTATNRPVGLPGNADIQSDLDIAPDGKFFASQNRAAGTGVYDEGRVNIRVIDTDGTTVLWDSLAQSTNALANATAADIFADALSIKVSPDGKKVAIIRLDTQTWVMNLTNGIPDISTRLLINTFAATSTGTANTLRRREVAFDAAGNMYVGNNSQERLVTWSPGGSTTAITTFDNTTGQGSFQLFNPTTVSVTAPIATTTEGGSAGRFTISRVGDTSGSVTVNYTLTGTANNGSDYTLPLSVTFLPGATSTNLDVTAVTDPDAEFTESVILTLASDFTYSIGSPATATVNIFDVHSPEVLVSGDTSAGARTNMIESFADSRAVFLIQRKGTLTSPLTVNLSYSGTAVNGTDYVTGSNTLTFAANVATTNLILLPINDPAVEAPEDFAVTVTGGGGYSVGSPATAGGLIYSEDLAPAPSTLFSDKFDTDSSPNWVVSTSSPTENDAAFGFDYSAFAIPEAPSSSGTFAATRGLKLRSHLTAALVLSGISASPLGGNFTGDYRLRFDLWMNYIGPLPLGGAGSTEHSSFGVGVSGTGLVWPTSVTTNIDGIWFTAATDSDVIDTSTTQGDYVAFAQAQIPANTGFYAAGSDADVRGNGNPYYLGWGGSTVPAQQALFPTQTGAVRLGALAMAWHAVTITKLGDEVTWDIDGIRIATVPISSTVGTMNTNFFLGFHDWFTSATTNATLEFALYDNVRVESLSPSGSITITSIQLINGGTDVQIDFTASPSDTTASFTLQASGTVNTGYGDVSSTITAQGSGAFRAVRAVSGSAQYYRVRHL